MTDAARRRFRVTRAFVDRASIDWRSLLANVGDDPDRDFYERLRALDRLRPSTDAARIDDRRLSIGLAICVVVLAATQATVSAVATAAAHLYGQASALPPQAVLACAFAVGAVVLVSAAHRDARTLFLLAWFALGAAAFSRYTLAAAAASWGPIQPVAGFVRHLAPEAFMPACLWEFALSFPRVQRFTTFDRCARAVASFAWLAGSVLFIVNLLDAYRPVRAPWAEYVLLKHPSGVFWRLFVAGLVPAVVALLIRTRRAASTDRRHVGRFIAATAVGISPFLTFGLLRATVPGVNEWFLAATPAERAWIDSVVLLGLAATPLLTSVAIVVDKPFDLHARVYRSSLNTIARGLASAATMMPFAAPAVLFYQQRRSAQLRRQLERGLDQVRLARGARELAVILEGELKKDTGSTAVTVLVRDPLGPFVDEFRSRASLPAESGLTAILASSDAPLDVSEGGELRRLLPAFDQSWLTANDVACLVALKDRDGTVSAIAALGPKRGAHRFDPEDLWLIRMLTLAAAARWHDSGFAQALNDEPPTGPRLSPSAEPAFECSRCRVVAAALPLPCDCRDTPALAALPSRLGDKFIVDRRLGAGGMGVVYLARDVALNRDVALKTLPRLAGGMVSRLREEARAMAMLNHESLAVIYGLDEWRQTPVLIVEYLPNGTLAQRLARGTLSHAETVTLGIALGKALEYMHVRGMLHRDLKPSNVGFTAADVPKLLDFGLATFDRAARAGTPAYLPPEAFAGAPATAGFDLWALSRVLRDAVGTPLPPELDAFFERALDVEPARRPPTATAWLAELDALRGTSRGIPPDVRRG